MAESSITTADGGGDSNAKKAVTQSATSMLEASLSEGHPQADDKSASRGPLMPPAGSQGQPGSAAQQQEQQQQAKPGEGGSASDHLATLVNSAVTAALKPLQEKMAAYEAREGKVEKERLALDTTENYLRTKMGDLPQSIVRAMLPKTTDENALAKAEIQIRREFENHYRSWLQQEVKEGRRYKLDSSGRLISNTPDLLSAQMDGGEVPGQTFSVTKVAFAKPSDSLPPNASATQLLASTLNNGPQR